MPKYFVLVAYETPLKLEELINDHLSKGWKLQGGVSVILDADGAQMFSQAIYNDSENMKGGSEKRSTRKNRK